MDKKFIYVQNALFLLFDEYQGLPEKAGEILANAVFRVLEIMYPEGRIERELAIRLQKSWIEKFYSSFVKKLFGK